VGMHRQGYDLQLTQYDDQGWRATFYTTGMEHSPTSATGTRTVKSSTTFTLPRPSRANLNVRMQQGANKENYKDGGARKADFKCFPDTVDPRGPKGTPR
jgi:hypothetical protein